MRTGSCVVELQDGLYFDGDDGGDYQFLLCFRLTAYSLYAAVSVGLQVNNYLTI